MKIDNIFAYTPRVCLRKWVRVHSVPATRERTDERNHAHTDTIPLVLALLCSASPAGHELNLPKG